MDHILTLCGGFAAGFLFLAWVFAENSKKRDFMMIDGKMKWVERTERLKEELEALKKKRIEGLK